MTIKRIISIGSGNTYVEIDESLGVLTGYLYENKSSSKWRLQITDETTDVKVDLKTDTTKKESSTGLSLDSDALTIRLTLDRGQFK